MGLKSTDSVEVWKAAVPSTSTRDSISESVPIDPHVKNVQLYSRNNFFFFYSLIKQTALGSIDNSFFHNLCAVG